MTPSVFIITIDTEGDNAWARPRSTTTENARYLGRFQALCERHGLKPTYLTNWEMAKDPVFVELGRDVIRRGTGEVGMHLHAWNSPPIVPLTADDMHHLPYLIEYPDDQMRAKIAALTELLVQTFQTPMASHRAGRWAFDERYARMLVEQGYRVDCTVTPGVSWSRHLGDPSGGGGTDYRGFPRQPYRLDPDDIGRAGDSSLLEVPMTILPRPFATTLAKAPARIRDLPPVRRLIRSPRWLRPTGRNRKGMLDVMRTARSRGYPHVEFMLHSSEFMPGGSPTFPDRASIERLYDDLEAVFAAADGFVGQTLTEFADGVVGGSVEADGHDGNGARSG